MIFKKNFLIITGLSGSGKTLFSNFLEDAGYFCVDNLPSKLIPKFIELYEKNETISSAAIVADIREKDFVKDFPEVFKALRKSKKYNIKLIFLEANDDLLIRRFKETRRPHPLSENIPLKIGVKKEKELLKKIKEMADEIIDTSSLTVPQLREFVRDKFGTKTDQKKMMIHLISFGYKWGIPFDSDLVLDVRFLPNPFYKEKLKYLSGKNKEVKDFILSSEDTKKYLLLLEQMLDFLIPKFISEGKSYLAISFGCTGGKHRSIIIAEEVKKILKNKGLSSKITHRDLNKE
ncbi:MAG: RNase adapter RapZ [Acidobacteriota bacterium]